MFSSLLMEKPVRGTIWAMVPGQTVTVAVGPMFVVAMGVTVVVEVGITRQEQADWMREVVVPVLVQALA